MNSKTITTLSYLTSTLMPFILIGFALRILLTPLFYSIEYNLPHFPEDPYGLTTEDRMHWAPFAVNYLVNNADISYLGNLKFGNGSPLFNDRELSHMQDVKNLVQGALRTWYAALAAQGILALIAHRENWTRIYLAGISRGSRWMIWLAVSLAVIAGTGITLNPDVFWQFFSLFHQAFFEGDSWLFLYSDTLIRLFPIRFWQDAVLAAAVLSLGGGLILAFGLREIQPSKGDPR